MLEHDNSGRRRWKVECRGPKAQRIQTAQVLARNFGIDQAMCRKIIKSQRSAEALRISTLKKILFFASLCLENLHAKAEVGGKFFGKKGGRKKWGARALPKLTPFSQFLAAKEKQVGPLRGQITARNK